MSHLPCMDILAKEYAYRTYARLTLDPSHLLHRSRGVASDPEPLVTDRQGL